MQLAQRRNQQTLKLETVLVGAFADPCAFIHQPHAAHGALKHILHLLRVIAKTARRLFDIVVVITDVVVHGRVVSSLAQNHYTQFVDTRFVTIQ